MCPYALALDMALSGTNRAADVAATLRLLGYDLHHALVAAGELIKNGLAS